MWSKRNKTLLIILIVLLVLIGLDQVYTTHQQQQSFRDILITADSSQIATIEFYPKNQTDKKITLQREKGQWYVISKKGKYVADNDKIREVLSILRDLKPIQVLGKTKDDWKTYGVTDTSALNVFVKDKRGKQIAHLYIGQIHASKNTGQNRYQQPRIATYVRLEGDKNVYLVPHLLALTFVNDPDAFRNNNLTPTFPADITQVDIQLPDTTFTIKKQAGKWLLNNMKADSLRCEDYTRLMQDVESQDFVPDSALKGTKQLAQVTIHYKDSSKIVIKGLGDSTISYVWSSYNPKTYFKARVLKDRIFKHYAYFKPHKTRQNSKAK